MVGQVARLAGEEDGRFRVGVEFLVYRGDARERIAAFVEAELPPARPGAPTAALPLTVRPFEEAREWEEELRASEIRKALILDSALDCILTADHEGRVIEFNAAARRLFGYSRSEILGREVADTIVPPALRDELRRCLRDFVLTGESADLGRRREATAMRADGSLVPVEVVVIPAYVKGRVILTAYIRDLTDQRRGERLADRPPARDPGPHRLPVARGGLARRARRARARPRLHGGAALGGGRRPARAVPGRDLLRRAVPWCRRRPTTPSRAAPSRTGPRRGRARPLAAPVSRSRCPCAWVGWCSGCSR